MADDFNDNPGPGAYKMNYELKYHQPPIYSIASKLRDRVTDEAAGLPGPGTYSPQLPDKGPFYSLPARLRGISSKDSNPGPGTYSHHARYTLSTPPSYSMATRLKGSRASAKTPGPGDYDPKLLGRRGPQYSLRARTAVASSREKNPGPGAYDPQVHNCIPAYSLGKRFGVKGAGDDTPGPGAYNTLGRRGGPCFTMRQRFVRKRLPGHNTR